MHTSGTGGATYAKMENRTQELTVDTAHTDALNLRYIFYKARLAHPKIFNQVMTKNENGRLIEWLTLKNINDWRDAG